MKTLRSRYSQANKEAKWAILLSFAYFAWWYFTAYKLAPPSFEKAPLPELYFGLPLWFLLSCILGPLLFTFLCAMMVKLLYRDISLNVEPEREHE